MEIIPCRGFQPQIGSGCFVAPTATLIGNVNMGARCSVWFNTVIRGDVEPIVIGEETNIQDGTIIHGTFHKAHATIGRRVTIGHGVMLHGCKIGDTTLVGMGSIIMDNSRIGSKCMVGAGSLVTENSDFSEEGWLILGRPAKKVRLLKPEEIAFLDKSADNYLMYMKWYQAPQKGDS
ncbi:MAG: gamma carbonic anhydrase family protein [Bdellovibrionales bacterium]|nr:gamma carbonic anhydrase family protein [Bdellovibrionales bacterium]